MEGGDLEQEIKEGTRLPKEKIKVLADAALQTGGVNLIREGRSLAISPEELRDSTIAREEMISPQDAVLALEAGGVAFDLLGLAFLTRQLRQLIERGVFDFSRKRKWWEKIFRRPSQKTPVNKAFSSTSLPSVESLVSSFAEVEAKAGLALEALALSPEGEDLNNLRLRVEAWQKIVGQWRDNLFGFSEEELANYQKIIESQREGLSAPQDKRKSYKERLEDLLANPQKRQRYADIFWSEKNAPQQARKAANLFLETALAVNTARVLHRLHDPAGKKEGGPLDLLAAREKAAELKKEAEEIRENSSLSQEEKQRQLEKLNGELIGLLIPIANKVMALFPHNTAYSLSAILAKEEAVCVGKTEALKAVCRWLGFEGRGVVVLETLDNKSPHSYLEVDSFTQTKIIIDGNYSSWHLLRSYSDEDIVKYVNRLIGEGKIPANEREKAIANFKKHKANSFHIPLSSEVLIYTLTLAGRKAEKNYRCSNFEAVRICPYTGERQTWQASVPFPHLLITPDRPREVISGGYHNSLGVSYHNQGKLKEAEEQYLEALRINPNNAKAHCSLGFLYSKERATEAARHFREFVRILEERGLTEDPKFVNYYQWAKEFLSKNSLS